MSDTKYMSEATSTITPRKPSHADTVKPIAGVDARFALRRHLTGYPYGQNSVGAATPQYEWHLLLDGRIVDSSAKAGTMKDAAKTYGVSGYTA